MEINTRGRDEENVLASDRDRTLRALEGKSQDSETSTQRAIPQSRKEDLFLNIAIDDSTRRELDDPSLRSERRKSRLRLASHRSSLPPLSYSSPTAQGSSPGPQEYDSPSSRGLQRHNRGNTYSFSSDFHCESPVSTKSNGSETQPFKEGLRNSRQGDLSRTSFGLPRGALEHRSSPESSTYQRRRISLSDSSQSGVPPPKRYRHGTLSNGTPSYYASSPLAQSSFESQVEDSERNQKDDDSESTVSTAAPSTVWDELDDLKSRIRKLEITGTLPSSSPVPAIDIPNGDRPRTAASSLSTAPRRTRAGTLSTVNSSCNDFSAANAHPLLLAALKKSKDLIHGDVYRALEAVASDALSLASMTGSTGMQSRPLSPASVLSSNAAGVDRRMRRKADSLCRGLTELCIALSEGKAETKPAHIPAVTGSESRRHSDISAVNGAVRPDLPMPRRQYQAIQDQGSPVCVHSSPGISLTTEKSQKDGVVDVEERNEATGTSVTPTQASAPSLSRPSRTTTGTFLRQRRLDGTDADIKTPSRSMTDIGRIGNNQRDRTAKEFTFQTSFPSQHPTTTSQPAPSTPLRGNYIYTPTSSIISQLPAGSFLRTGSRRLVDRSTTGIDLGSALRIPDRREIDARTRQLGQAGRLRAGSAGPASAAYTRNARTGAVGVPGDAVEQKQ